MNTSFYWHLSFWANAGHNISTVTISNKHCCRPSNQNYSNASSCIKQFESLERYSTVLSLIFLNLESQLQNLIRTLWTTQYCKTHQLLFDFEACKQVAFPPPGLICLFILLSSVFRGLILLSPHISYNTGKCNLPQIVKHIFI